MSETNKNLVRRWVEEIFNQRIFAVCDEIMAQVYDEHAIAAFGQSESGSVNGPQHMRQVAEWLVGQYPDLQMTVVSIIGEGDRVACLVLAEGTNLGKLNGVLPPTGKRLSVYQSHWFRVEDGKLAEHWAVRDDLRGMLQLGVISPPGGRPA